MSFLDNLENSLKSLESREEGRDEALRSQQSRDKERAAVAAAATYTEELKKGPFTAELLRQSARVGHGLRTKIHVAWLGSNLRLEARVRRLELRPTASGVLAVYSEGGSELRAAPLDLTSAPEALLKDWLAGLTAPVAETPPAE